MPIPSPGGPAAAGGGGDGAREIKEHGEALNKLITIEERHLKQLEREKKLLREDLELVKKGTTERKNLEDKLKKVNAEYRDAIDLLDKYIHKKVEEERYLRSSITKYAEASQKFTAYAKSVRDGVASFYSYQLTLQNAIDKTGKFVGNSSQARAEFEKLRSTINLTSSAVGDFAQTWTEAMQLGITNKQLGEMVTKLQQIRGHAGGFAAIKEIMAAPVSRTTALKAAGGDVQAIATAIRAGNAEQAHAFADLLGKPAARPREAREAAEFEIAEAKIAKSMDDLKMGFHAALAAGFGPQTAALVQPIAQINENVAKLVSNSERYLSTFSSFAGSFAGSGGLKSLMGSLTGGGGGTGGIMNLLKGGGGKLLGSGFGRGGLAGAALYGASVGLDYGADATEKAGYTKTAHGMRAGGSLARVGAFGATGAAIGSLAGPIGTGVGGVIGAGIGAANEWGPQGIEFAKSAGDYFKTQVFGAAANKEDRGGDLLREAFKQQISMEQQMLKGMDNLANEIEKMPSSLEAKLAGRGLEAGIQAVDSTRFESAAKVIGESLEQRLARASEGTQKEIGILIKERDKQVANLRGQGKFTEATALGKNYDVVLTEAATKFQDALKGMNLGQVAEAVTQRTEARRGQVGLERQAATGQFQLTGAVTGDRQAGEDYQTAINETYAQEAELLQEGKKQALAEFNAAKEALDVRMQIPGITDKQLQVLKNEKLILENQELQYRRNISTSEKNLALETRNQQIEALRFKINEYERTVLYRRSQQQQALAKAQEEFIRERGATPEEMGGLASTQAADAAQMLSEFRDSFKDNMADLTEQKETARAGGDEARAVLLEKEIFDLRQKGVELERNAFQTRLHAATAEHEERMKQVGIQKSMLETVRDSAARTGQSWRVQMGYQSKIIQASRVDLEEARAAFAAAKEAGLTGAPLMEKQLAIVQKENALREAVMGKQRDFLEKAVAAGFGMGGGSKALPNFSPRVFGEIVKDVTGMQWQGAPKTIGQTRQAMGGNMVGAIGGGGIGVGGGGLNVVGRPGVNPEAGGAAAVAMAGPGGGAKGGSGSVDISGNVNIFVKSDDGVLVTKIDKRFDAKFKSVSNPGSST